MNLRGSHRFAAPVQTVWDALHNADILQKSVPGAKEITWQGESSVHIFLRAGIGPFKGEGGMTAQVSEHVPPSHMKLAFDHHGHHNNAKGELVIDLVVDGTGTLLSYAATATLGGLAAAVDNPLTRPIMESQLGQVFARLDQQLH
jgi:carbon monoxide dehydrogenase subunit G